MTDKEKIADAANNMENKYIKNIPTNRLRLLKYLGKDTIGVLNKFG